MGTNVQSMIAPASDGAPDQPGPDDELGRLLAPWEGRRRRRPANPPGPERNPALTLGFNFVDAPPIRVRQGFKLLRYRVPDDHWLSRPNDQPPQVALVELAEKHWGRIGGSLARHPSRMRVDLLSVPAAKAATVEDAIRTSWPDALPVASVHTWSSWAAIEPLGHASGDHFDRLDLDGAAVVTWWWD